MEYFKFNKIHKLVKVIDKNGNKYRITFLYLKQWPNVEIKQGNRYVRIEDYYHKLNNYQPSKNIPEFSSFARKMAIKDLGREFICEYAIKFHKMWMPNIDVI